jgi:sigma-B regulation protein RsbU (phosphoserine phosphatase)
LTGLILKFDDSTGKVVLYDMGHGYLYLLRDKNFYALQTKSQNLPIGITEQMPLQSHHFVMKKGDILISFTDGIVEQTNEQGAEYSVNKIAEFIIRYKAKALDISIDELFADIQRFKGTEPQHDDMTLMVLQYK